MLILTPASFSLTLAAGPSTAVDWATSGNGQQPSDQGTGPLSALPARDEVVLVLPPQSVSWHTVNLPKVPASRLRALLDGMLEERVLRDTAELHFALAPGAKAGQKVWVAACHKAWIKSWIQALENAGRPVTRIVPGLAPLATNTSTDETDTATGIVHWAHHQSGQAWLASASANGVSCSLLMPNTGAALTGLTPVDSASPTNATWFAEPAAATLAEQCLDQRFELLTLPSWLLRCAQSDWNLAQFDLSLSNAARRGQRWRQAWRQWRSAPAWKAARWGLIALAAVHLIGINAAAWQERRALQTKKQALSQILQNTFPNVTLVVDAPIQMQREIALMRQSSGQLSTHDLEAMLTGLAQASANQPMVLNSLQYQRQSNSAEGRFGADRAPAEVWPTLQAALNRAGWQASFADTTITLRPVQP